MKILSDGTCLLASSTSVSGMKKMVKEWSFGELDMDKGLRLLEKSTGNEPDGLRVVRKDGRLRFEMTGCKK